MNSKLAFGKYTNIGCIVIYDYKNWKTAFRYGYLECLELAIVR
jgi:hypothetical protein